MVALSQVDVSIPTASDAKTSVNTTVEEVPVQDATSQIVEQFPASVIQQPHVHHGLPFLAPVNDESIERLVLPDLDKADTGAEPIFHSRVYGELAEHDHLGNSIYLQDPKDASKHIKASRLKINLANGLELTYGQINWLAGDFYATNNPISNGQNLDQRKQYFEDGFNYLATRPEAKDEAEAILKQGQVEIDKVNEALQAKQDPSTAYQLIEKLVPWDTWKKLTDNRPSGMGYIGLAQQNFDHFGEDARKAYDAGHTCALAVAASGDLNQAYALNAFADHFLQDRFSAGHLRTPRRFCHLNLVTGFGALDTGSLCAKYMHDEDSAIGLDVANTAGETWKCYGDKRMLDTEDSENKRRCILALKQSTEEIMEAYNNRRVPDKVGLVWDIAPTLESACDQSKQELSPLFTPDGKVRNDVKNRRDPSHSESGKFETWFGWFSKIALECQLSGRWDYPIQM